MPKWGPDLGTHGEFADYKNKNCESDRLVCYDTIRRIEFELFFRSCMNRPVGRTDNKRQKNWNIIFWS